MTAEEAVRQAEAEELTLLKADNTAGYKGVSFDSKPNLAKPYHAKLKRDGKDVSIGYFATAKEAALIIARNSAAQAAVQAAAQAASQAASQAVAQAPPPTVDEGLVVLMGEIVEDSDEEYVEVEGYVPGEDDNDEAVFAEVCLDNTGKKRRRRC